MNKRLLVTFAILVTLYILSGLFFYGNSAEAQGPRPTNTPRPTFNQKPTPTPSKTRTANSRRLPSSGNLVINGDFEIPYLGGSYVNYAPDNWTIESGTIDFTSTGFWQHASGQQSLDLNGWSPGTIYQDISTVSGQSYLLTFAMAGNPDGGPQIKSMEVWWGSNLVGSPTFDITGHTRSSMGWVYRSYIVTATSSISRLRFKSTTIGNGDATGPTLDAVSVIGNYITYSVLGQVTDDSNNTVPGVNVLSSSGNNATTDASGFYTITNLITGTYTITPTLSGYSFSPGSRTVNVPPNLTGQDFVAMAPPQLGSVPFFSQRDPNWITSPLGTNGGCSANCSTIGACGCALTSATMVFAYYGANLIPPTLSTCMGNLACPFYWLTGASCTNGKANWVNQNQFNWNRLDYELNQNQRPVILGMHRKGNPNNTHWVVVVSGSGSDPSNYVINDPWFGMCQ